MKPKVKKTENKLLDQKLDRVDRVLTLGEKAAKVGLLIATIIEKVLEWFK